MKIDRAGFVVATCAAAAFADGYDVQALGLAIPRMAADLHLAPTAFAIAASTSLIGMALGAMLLSPLADRYGRERALAVMMAMIAATTFAATFVTSPLALAFWRFFSGLGLGAVVPVAIALTAAQTSARHRASLITLMVSFTGVGAFAAGQIAPLLDGVGGWRAIFGVGAVLPLIGAVAAWCMISEAEDVAQADPAQRASVRALFASPLQRLTALVWALFWLNLMVNYSLISWLPTLLGASGWDLGAASRATGLISIGGIIGGLAISALTDRGLGLSALLGAYVVAALTMVAFGLLPAGQGLWTWLILLVGVSAFGAQLALSAIVAGFYPPAMRATAIGWSSGFGRSGAFVGPLIMAGLMAAGTSPRMILAAMTVPMLVCVLGVVALGRVLRKI